MSDPVIARLTKERADHVAFVDQLMAENTDRDLSERDLEMVAAKRGRVEEIDKQLDQLESFAKARERAQVFTGELLTAAPSPAEAKYDTASAYIVDRWQASAGVEAAMRRMTAYHRVAAHQTTADNPGTVPDPILGPVLSFIDANRPAVSALGPRSIPNGPTFYRPLVTQHTAVAVQSAEKAELASQKMTIDRVQVDVATYGGYVNVSRQDIDWSTPSALDLVVQDLASAYAVGTEAALGTALVANATASGATIAAADADGIAAAFWTAAGNVYDAVKGIGRVIALCAPNVLGMIGPVFAPYGPQNVQAVGFTAGGYGTGPQGTVSGIPVYASAGLADGTLIVMSTAAQEVYEQRIGTLQVVEPSVLGVQVAYAGYFGVADINGAGVQTIATA